MRLMTFAKGLAFLVLAAVSGPTHAQVSADTKAAEPAKATTATKAAKATKVSSLQTAESQAAMTPASALDKLKKGNARFVGKNMRIRDWQAKVSATAGGQYPFAAILACMDSRTPIEIIFDQGIGDVFGIRIAGNIVNEDELGSMEYATKVVGTKLLVVLGHTSCGAVKGAIDDAKLGYLTALLAKIRRAVSASDPGSSKDDAYVARVAQVNVSLAMKDIREKSPTLKAQIDAGTVGLVGAMYDVSTGKVTFLAD